MSRFVDFKAVKAAVTMPQVLEHYDLAESFKRTGNSLSGPCPLHNGQNRTQFRVSLEKNCWNCFGTCNGGGNVLDFVARKEGCSLRDAAVKLCDWFQLPTQERPPRSGRNATEKPKTDALPKAEHPAKEPNERGEPTHAKPTKSAKAKNPDADEDGPNRPLGFALQHLDAEHPYLLERGVSLECVAHFGLGHCAKGSMTGRIVVPIHNADGQLVAYAGRWPGTPPDEDTPKYKLPPGFRKAQEVFNLHRAAQEPHGMPLFVVEGFFDCLRLWQHGIRRVVALMGSTLSPEQAALIQRITASDDRIVVMFDQDDAGRAGREKAVARLSLHCFVHTHRFAQEGQQPDALTPEQIAEIVAQHT
jgi:DNA primase